MHVSIKNDSLKRQNKRSSYFILNNSGMHLKETYIVLNNY